MFWQEQGDELRRRAQVKRMLAEVPPAGSVAHGLSDLTDQGLDAVAAAAAASAAMQGQLSAHAAIFGNPNSEFMRRLRWFDMLKQAHAQGAERMVVLDATAVDGVHVDVDVKLGLYAAELDVLDALAPLLRHQQLVDETKLHLHEQALHAMADKDTSCE